MFKPVGSKELLSKKVSREIEEAIRSRKIGIGDKLPSELELCEQFNVSRTAIREALRMLSAKGMISIEKGRGIFVKSPTSDHVASSMQYYLSRNGHDDNPLWVIEARLIIEPAIAENAALNHTADDIKQLQTDVDLMKKNKDHERHAQLDLQFHTHVAQATGNPIMPLMIQPIHSLMPKIKSRIMDTVPNAKESAVEWHQKVVNAIKSRDPRAAYDMMKQHLTIAREHTEQMLRHG
jgi:GntR family transcriptional repressor for pyruvate dehydrogenase complex